MNLLSGITSLKALNQSIVMEDKMTPLLDTNKYGGRFVKVKISETAADGTTETFEVKVSINTLVSKMRQLMKEDQRNNKFDQAEIKSGEKICKKVEAIKDKEMVTLKKTPLQWLGSRVARLNNLFSDKKTKIGRYKEEFQTAKLNLRLNHQNVIDELPLTPSGSESVGGTTLNLLSNRSAIDTDLKKLRADVVKGDFEAVKSMVNQDKELVNAQYQNGNTILHILAELMVAGDIKNDHPAILDFLKENGADIEAQNNDGKKPSDIVVETMREKGLSVKERPGLVELFLPKIEVLHLEGFGLDATTVPSIETPLDDVSLPTSPVLQKTVSSESAATTLDLFEIQLRANLGSGPIPDAMVQLGRNFFGAVQRMENGPQITEFDVNGNLQTGMTLKVALDKPIIIDAGPLIKQLNKLHPNGLGFALKALAEKFLSGGYLMLDPDMIITARQEGGKAVIDFNRSFYFAKGEKRFSIHSLNIVQDPVKGIILEAVNGDKSRRATLKAVLTSLEEGTGVVENKKAKIKADHRIQWKKVVNQV